MTDKKRLQFKFRLRYKISLILLLIIIGIGLYLFSSLHYKADVNQTVQYITLTANATYQDASGHTNTTGSNDLKVEKVNIRKFTATLRGLSSLNGLTGKIEILDPDTAASVGTINFVLSDTGTFTPDWTGINNIDPHKRYDLRISTPNWLSRKITDVLVNSTDDLTTGTFVAGDLNNDGTINYQDYIAWKNEYGKTGQNVADFNHDGVVNFVDFAMSFGSRCYNANENNQDNQCNQ